MLDLCNNCTITLAIYFFYFLFCFHQSGFLKLSHYWVIPKFLATKNKITSYILPQEC